MNIPIIHIILMFLENKAYDAVIAKTNNETRSLYMSDLWKIYAG